MILHWLRRDDRDLVYTTDSVQELQAGGEIYMVGGY
jgi:hypothetical protein